MNPAGPKSDTDQFDMGLHKDVVELLLAAPQQSPVIGHCLTAQIEAESEGHHSSVTQLPMTGGC